VTFLDPFTKSGIFLREIVERLTSGLADEIPNLQTRVNHILLNQVFGIGITQLTSLLARRSIYCSKSADGEHSVGKFVFENEDGNIWFESMQHTWVGGREITVVSGARHKRSPKKVGGKCKYCGASQSTLDRADGLETHAYAFIHTDDIKARMAEMFGGKMQFDVIIGNPPYQLSDGGHAASATPIYHKFVEQAIALDPRFLSMVTPSRWFSGGRGLDGFRAKMLSDRRIRTIVDFIVDKDAFPNININGGVNYFLWERDSEGDCSILTVEPGGAIGEPVTRSLNEFDIFIRRNLAVSILRKVRAENEPTFDSHVSSLRPFGFRTNFFGADSKSRSRSIKIYSSGKVTWVSRSEIESKTEWIDDWKVLIAAATDGNENYPLPIWDATGPFVAGLGEACTETYLVADRSAKEEQAKLTVDYMRTKFFRFLVSLRKVAQHNKADNFSFVPDLPMDRAWTDEMLYAKYGITDDEIAFINKMIRPMDVVDE
jgi:site-specific DNA-methyltransferase (adenine-specific)